MEIWTLKTGRKGKTEKIADRPWRTYQAMNGQMLVYFSGAVNGVHHQVRFNPEDIKHIVTHRPALKLCDEVFGGDSRAMWAWMETLDRVLGLQPSANGVSPEKADA